MASPNTAAMTDRPFAVACAVKQRLSDMTSRRKREQAAVITTSFERLAASLNDEPFDTSKPLENVRNDEETVLYLAYGSNLCNETFRGKRGIKPLSQVNVQVPSLRLTFDLPGIAYVEPCFANSGTRDPDDDPPKSGVGSTSTEKSPLLGQNSDNPNYRKDAWHKGLIGVVYEVTAKDYAHIIATEGGGSSYHDILVDCHPFASSDPTKPVPQNPTLPPFKAHTLFAPATPPGEDPPPKDGGRFQRPDTSYAQPSARYLKLITDGADELGLPYEYQDYLHSLRPYTITSAKQRVGAFVFLSIWLPIVSMVFAMGKIFVDEKGRQPAWMREFTGAVFKGTWASYDSFFKPMFGDGERTIADGGDDSGVEGTARGERRKIERSWSWRAGAVEGEGERDVEKTAAASQRD